MNNVKYLKLALYLSAYHEISCDQIIHLFSLKFHDNLTKILKAIINTNSI